MNELLQKHGCSNVFQTPEGLKELMTDISREVLREQPSMIYDFIANYLSALMMTREHGIMAIKILDDLCDCRPTVSQHLLQLGFSEDQVRELAQIIKEEIEEFQPVEGKIKEYQIVKRILNKMALDETTSASVCQVIRNAYRDYWYRKKTLEKRLRTHPDEPWEIAAQRTLEIYKKTKPSFDELTRAAQKIQAAYKGYYIRRNLLQHLKPKKKKGAKVNLPGPPLDIAGSRQIEFGPIINVRVHEDDVEEMLDKGFGEVGGTTHTITYVPEAKKAEPISARISEKRSPIQFSDERETLQYAKPRVTASQVYEDKETPSKRTSITNVDAETQSAVHTISSEQPTGEMTEENENYVDEDITEVYTDYEGDEEAMTDEATEAAPSEMVEGDNQSIHSVPEDLEDLTTGGNTDASEGEAQEIQSEAEEEG